MRTPEALETLVEYGIVEEVLRPLMSGKEAQIFLVRSQGELRVAKVYKEAQQRSFKQRAEYTEGRKIRNPRDQRAMAKHSKHGKAQDEAAWRSAEVNAIYRLRAAGVRVPEPYHFVDGVLVMELVKDADGDPAPRLGDLQFDAAGARQIYEHLLVEVIRMLCAGVVHGDLSEFNVLMAADGPVVIDFPQAVDPSVNQGARRLLLRDVDNLHRFLERFVRGLRPPPYAQEMWDLYQSNLLTPETPLRGRHVASQRPANTADVLAIIGDAERDHRRRQAREQGPGGPRSQAPRGSQQSAAGQGGQQAPRDSQRGPGGPAQQAPRDSQRGPGGQGPRDPQRGSQGPSQHARGPQGATSDARPGPRGPKVEVQISPPDDRNRGPRTPAAPARGPERAPGERAPAGEDAAGSAPRKRRRRRSGSGAASGGTASGAPPAAGSGSRA